MNFPKTTRRKGIHTMPLKTPKLPTQIGPMPKMKQAIKPPKLKQIGYGQFPKGHVY